LVTRSKKVARPPLLDGPSFASRPQSCTCITGHVNQGMGGSMSKR
jgi:hypothetical protein